MAQLQEIVYKVSIRSIHGPRERIVDNLQTDSRQAGPGTLFIALKGTHADGHRFIPQVISAGASVIVCQDLPHPLQEGVTYIQVGDSAVAAGIIAHNFYGQPSERLKLVGVTGTNGKTTIAPYPTGVSDVELVVDPYFPKTVPSVADALRGRAAHPKGRNALYLDCHAAFFRDAAGIN